MKKPNTPDRSSAEFFEQKYRSAADPWQFAENKYELARYDCILRALSGCRYRHAWEPGCSVGVLTERLAAICDRVDACDFSPTAVREAQQRCAQLPGVLVRCASLTDPAPIPDYDVIVWSEIGYYFTKRNLQHLMSDAVQRMRPGTILLASHWLGSSPDHILSGDEVHELMHHSNLKLQHSERHPDAQHGGFRLDRWSRV